MKCMYIACLLLNSLLVLTAQMCDWILVLVIFKCKNHFLFKFFFYLSNQILFSVVDNIRVSLKSLLYFLLVIFIQKKGALYFVFTSIVSLSLDCFFNFQSPEFSCSHFQSSSLCLKLKGRHHILSACLQKMQTISEQSRDLDGGKSFTGSDVNKLYFKRDLF